MKCYCCRCAHYLDCCNLAIKPLHRSIDLLWLALKSYSNEQDLSTIADSSILGAKGQFHTLEYATDFPPIVQILLPGACNVNIVEPPTKCPVDTSFVLMDSGFLVKTVFVGVNSAARNLSVCALRRIVSCNSAVSATSLVF